MLRNFYDLFNVPPDAAQEEVRDAYQDAVVRYHPDQNKQDDAEQKIRVVKVAGDVLLDSGERERYDSIGHKAYVRKESIRLDGFSFSSTAGPIRNSQADQNQQRGGEYTVSEEEKEEFINVVNDIIEDQGAEISDETDPNFNYEPEAHNIEEDEPKKSKEHNIGKYDVTPSEQSPFDVAKYAVRAVAPSRFTPIRSTINAIRSVFLAIWQLWYGINDFLFSAVNNISVVQFYILAIGGAIFSLVSIRFFSPWEWLAALGIYVFLTLALSQSLPNKNTK